MRKLAWMGTAVAALALGFASPALSHGPHAGKIAIDSGERVDLSELADGESRTFGDGEHAITATRTGDVIAIGVGDESIECLAGEDHCFVILASKDDGEEVKLLVRSGDDSDLDHEVRVMEFSTVAGDCDMDDCDMDDCGMDDCAADCEMHAVHGDARWVEDGGKDIRIFIDDADGEAGMPHLIRLHSEGVVLRCPEGDTTMRLRKDEAAKGPFFCPLHNLELEKVEPAKLHRELLERIHERDGDQ